MGRLGWEAVMSRDYPVIMGVGVLSAILTLLGNLLADVLYAYADPRIRYQ
jgi:peptide/nickel transport system permease protein